MSVPTLTYAERGRGARVDLAKLVTSRMLVQANSGGGKSRAIRSLAEETHGRIPQIIIDPEGEFATLRESLDYVLAAKVGGDVEATPKTAKLLCRRLIELKASAVLDIFELSLPERREFVRLFLTELVGLPRSLWHPTLVIVDEAHMFAPEKGQGESQSLEAMIALSTLGRKRGFCAVFATQRISKLHKDAAAELLNKMIGRTGLDVDMDRAAKELGFDKERRRTLSRLEPGQFYVYGPAIANEVELVTTGPVQTTHPEPGEVEQSPPPPSRKVKALLEASLADLPKEAETEARTVADLQRQVRELSGKLRHAEKSAVEKIVEKKVVDQGSIDRAVRDVVRKLQEKQKAALSVLRKEGRSLGRVTAALAASARELEPIANAIAALPDEIDKASSEDPAVRTLDGPPTDRTIVLRSSEPRGPVRAEPSSNGDGPVPRPQQRILDTIAQFETLGVERPSRSNIGAFLGVSSTTGSFKNYLGSLRTSGYITYPTEGQVALTDEGRALANPESGPRSLVDLHQTWLQKLPTPQVRILRILLQAYPDQVSRVEIGRVLEVQPTTGSFKNYLGALRSLGLIDYPSDGVVVATNLLFPEGMG